MECMCFEKLGIDFDFLHQNKHIYSFCFPVNFLKYFARYRFIVVAPFIKALGWTNPKFPSPYKSSCVVKCMICC